MGQLLKICHAGVRRSPFVSPLGHGSDQNGSADHERGDRPDQPPAPSEQPPRCRPRANAVDGVLVSRPLRESSGA